MIFTHNFITTLLGISPMKLGKKSLFHIGTGADIRPQIRSRKITVIVCLFAGRGSSSTCRHTLASSTWLFILL